MWQKTVPAGPVMADRARALAPVPVATMKDRAVRLEQLLETFFNRAGQIVATIGGGMAAGMACQGCGDRL